MTTPQKPSIFHLSFAVAPLLVISQAWGFGSGPAKPAQTEGQEAVLTQPKLGPAMAPLSSTLREKLNGHAIDDPTRRAELGHFADEFIEFKRGRPGLSRNARSAKRAEYVQKCELQMQANPFCRLIVDPDTMSADLKHLVKHHHEHVTSKVISRIRHSLAKADVSDLVPPRSFDFGGDEKASQKSGRSTRHAGRARFASMSVDGTLDLARISGRA